MAEGAEDRGSAMARSEYVDLTAVFEVLATYKWLILAITLLAMAGAYGLSQLMTPRYEAEVLVIPASDQDRNRMMAMLGGVGAIAGLAGMSGVDTTKKETAKAILESRRFAEAFIEDRELMPVLFAGLWDEEAQTWRVEADEDVPTSWDAVRLFRNAVLDVTEDPRSGLISVAVTWKDPEVAADWANALVMRLNETVQRREIDISQRTIEYLNRELENTSVVELRTAIYGLIEEQIQRIAFASVRDEFAFQVLDPAVVADPDDYVSPNRPLIVGFGGVAGIAAGFGLALLLSVWRRSRTRTPE